MVQVSTVTQGGLLIVQTVLMKVRMNVVTKMSAKKVVLMMSTHVVTVLVFLIIGNVMAGMTAQMLATKLIVLLTLK